MGDRSMPKRKSTLAVLALALAAPLPAMAQEPDEAAPKYGRGLNLPPDLGEVVRQVNSRVGSARLRLRTRAVTAVPPTYRYPNLPPVRNQGEYGNCWCFASNTVLDALYLANGQVIDASEQYVIDHNGDGFGCNGGNVAFDFLMETGTAAETDCPYKGCLSRDNAKVSYRVDAWAYVGDDQSAPSDGAMKAAILANGPLAVGVAANGVWDTYRGGAVVLNNRGVVNHEVVIYGWDDTKRSWLVRNSWGTTWGNNGDCWVQYGACSIGVGAAYAAVSPPTPPPTPVPTPPTPVPTPPTPPPTPGPVAPGGGPQVLFATPIYFDLGGVRYGLVNVPASATPTLLFLSPAPGSTPVPNPTPQVPAVDPKPDVPAPPPAEPLPEPKALPPAVLSPILPGPYRGPVKLVYVGDRYREFQTPSFLARARARGAEVVAMADTDLRIDAGWSRLRPKFPAVFWGTDFGIFGSVMNASPVVAIRDLDSIRRGTW